MKNQFFGIEIEMTGITRQAAAQIIASHFGTSVGYADSRTESAMDTQGRTWKLTYDGSIKCMKKENGTMVSAGSEYSTELVSPKLIYADMDDLQEIVRKLRHAGAVSDSKYKCGIHIHIDGSNHTPNTLRNIVNLVASKEALIYKSLDVDQSRLSYCRKMNEQLIETINRRKPKTIQQLADIWYAEFPNQSRDRHYHDSRYYGLNLHSMFEKGTVEFRLFNGTLHAGEIRAYIVLCLALSHQALVQKFSSPRRSNMENEKYTFRCWMLRMGLIGDEYKNCREHLMKNLNGNAAWRDPAGKPLKARAAVCFA